ncbi:MAG: selenite/tellurite reduction operon c-type cytochrome lipoprotein ExtS [Desulfuromonadaceae bacterium]|nr:selenite/tellurite reduction operon c-type cytochrome lipoprotein ExtS [Desulfuromonadaceae bacterium]
MVSPFLSLLLLIAAVVPAWGGQPQQLCLSCHPVHFSERGVCSQCHLGNPASDRQNIAHAGLRGGNYSRFTLYNERQKKEGQQLMEQLGCRRCHVSGGRGNRLSANLDGSAVRKRAGELALSIQRPVVNMPDFALDEARITELVNMILLNAQGRNVDEAAPVTVHFSRSGAQSIDLFSKKCGSCHRLLSQRRGALGAGQIGPNLSGLFSEFYPKTFRNGESWTPRNLAAWLKNPRESRPMARMQPVSVTGSEMKELESIMYTD